MSTDFFCTFLFTFLAIITTSHFSNSLNISLSQTAICDSNCSGTPSNPYSNLSEALDSSFNNLQQNLSDSTLNIFFQGTYYIIYDWFFFNNKYLFLNWESDMVPPRNLSITFQPENCNINEKCEFYVKILVKTQKIHFFLPSSFSLSNLIFDFGDSLLDSTKYPNELCYLNSDGCCNDFKFYNVSHDCNLVKTINRVSSVETNLFEGDSYKKFLLKNVIFKDFYSIDNDNYFTYMLKIQQNSEILILNSSFQGLYMKNSLINIGTNSILIINNSIISDYNKFEYYEELPTVFFPYIFMFTGENSMINFTNITINNSHFAIYSNQNHFFIENSLFSLRYSSTFSITFKENLGFIKFLSENIIFIHNSLFSSSKFRSIYNNGLNKMSLFALNSNSFINLCNCSFVDLTLNESYFLMGSSNITLILDNILMKNIQKLCSDSPTNCLYNYIELDSMNKVLINNSFFDSLYFVYDINFLKMNTNNNILMNNCSFTSIFIYNSNADNFFYFISNNQVIVTQLLFSNFIETGISQLFFFASNNVATFNDSKFISGNPATECSQVAKVVSFNTLTFYYTFFQNMPSYYPGVFFIDVNNLVAFFQCVASNIQAVYGGFFLITGNNNKVDFNYSTISNTIAYAGGGLLYVMGLNNKINIQSTKISSTISYYQGGLFSMQNNQIVYIIDSIITSSMSMTYGGLFSCISQNYVNIQNTTIAFSVASINGGIINALDSNEFYLNNTSIMLGSSTFGQGGGMYAFSSNKFSLYNVKLMNISSENEGGCFFLDNLNIVIMMNSSNSFITTNTEGTYFYVKTSNIINITNSSFTNLKSSFGAGFLKAEQLNNISLISSIFDHIECSSDGGMLYLNNENRLNMKFSVISNIVALKGGIMLVSTENILRISNTSFSNIEAISQAGGFWLYYMNDLFLENNTFEQISTKSGAGGLFYGYQMNQIFFRENQMKSLYSENYGGFAFLSLMNNLTVQLNSLNNCVGSLGGGLVYSEHNNNIYIFNNSFESYEYIQLFYLDHHNFINFSGNTWNIQFGNYHSNFFYAGTENTGIISNDLLNFSNS